MRQLDDRRTVNSGPRHDSAEATLLVSGAVMTISALEMRKKPVTERDYGLREFSEHRSADRSPGHRARKSEVVIIVAIEIRLV